MGRRPQGLRLGDRDLASAAAGPVLGQRLLEARRPGLVSRPRILERPEDRPARLPQERPARRSPRRRAGRAARAPTASTSPASTIPTATAWSGRRGSGPRLQPGWSWVPAQWVRQPEGWVFQEGYWDRTLEDRGTLFAPAEVDKSAKQRAATSSISPTPRSRPRCYGQLYGAFGRPNSYYDGYPGCLLRPERPIITATPTTATSAAITATSITRTTAATAIPTMLDAGGLRVWRLRRLWRLRRIWRLRRLRRLWAYGGLSAALRLRIRIPVYGSTEFGYPYGG